MRGRSLAGAVISRLAVEPRTRFADQTAWQAHLQRLGITGMQVTPDPVGIATEGALWGAAMAHGLSPDTVIVSDGAGQFDVGQHALCWAQLPKVPPAKPVEWQWRAMPSGWSTSSTPSPTCTAPRKATCAA